MRGCLQAWLRVLFRRRRDNAGWLGLLAQAGWPGGVHDHPEKISSIFPSYYKRGHRGLVWRRLSWIAAGALRVYLSSVRSCGS